MCKGNCKAQSCDSIKKNNAKTQNSIFWWVVAVLSLSAAWIYGYMSNKANDKEMLSHAFKDAQIEVISKSDRLYKLTQKDKEYVLGLGSAWGYGGNMEVASVADSTGKIEKIVLIEESETYAYVQRMIDRNYFMQYQGKNIDEAFSIGHDLDAVSGATVSSLAISRAVQDGGHTLAENYFDLQPEKVNGKFKVPQSVLGLVVFFLLSLFLFGRKKWMNIALLVGAIIGIGIMWNNSFSVSSLSKLFTGGFPKPMEDLTFYVILVFLIGGIILLKKNIYCYRICPFYGVQFLLSKLSGMRLEMSPVILKYSRFVKRFLLWFALFVMFLSQSPTIANFEPFGLIFSLEGHGVQWYILPAVIVGALFSHGFFCKHFCPAGESLNILTDLRKGKLFKSQKSKIKITFKELKIKKKNLLPTLLYLLALFVIVAFMVSSLMGS